MNDNLLEQVNDGKVKNEFIVKKFDEETLLLKEKLEFYRHSLNQLYGQIQFQTTTTENNNRDIDNNIRDMRDPRDERDVRDLRDNRELRDQGNYREARGDIRDIKDNRYNS